MAGEAGRRGAVSGGGAQSDWRHAYMMHVWQFVQCAIVDRLRMQLELTQIGVRIVKSVGVISMWSRTLGNSRSSSVRVVNWAVQ